MNLGDKATVVPAATGHEALARWAADRPDLVLLDVNLPDLSGFAVCQRIRQASTTPIIVLTGRTEEADVLQGLHLGADDYVTKPCSPRQLMARIAAVLRRSQQTRLGQPARPVRVGELVLEEETHSVTKGEVFVALTPLHWRVK